MQKKLESYIKDHWCRRESYLGELSSFFEESVLSLWFQGCMVEEDSETAPGRGTNIFSDINLSHMILPVPIRSIRFKVWETVSEI